MRKLKTRRSAAKRFRVTGSGKVFRNHSHARHILTKKSRKRKRKLNKRGLVSQPEVHTVRRMILA